MKFGTDEGSDSFDKFNSRVETIADLYFNCMEKAMNDYKEGKSVDEKVLYSFHDSIRILGHIKKMLMPQALSHSNKSVGTSNE